MSKKKTQQSFQEVSPPTLFYTGRDIKKAHDEDIGFDISPSELKIVYEDGWTDEISCDIPDDTFEAIIKDLFRIQQKRGFWKKSRGVKRLIFDSGTAIQPLGKFWMMVCANSRVCKTNYVIQNGVGIIDPNYRGTVRVVYTALSPNWEVEDIMILKRTCGQLVPFGYVNPKLEKVRTLSDTARGAGGFGSTDKKA